MIRCEHCQQEWKLGSWLRSATVQGYQLWTAKELAAIYGCSAVQMGRALNRLFPAKRVSLGPDGNVGRKRTLYCVWPNPFPAFFVSQTAETLRALWRRDAERRDHLARATAQAKRARHVETLDRRRTAS
jgi:hypothetical protein